MNLILTGATGFLGSHLARAFVQEGHRVIALKRQTSDLNRLADVRSDVIFYDLDNLDLAKPFTEQGPIDAVIHTATSYGRAGELATQVFEANTAFPLRLLETATRFNTDTFFNTDTILYPYLNAYALSKKHFTEWGRQLVAHERIRFVNICLEHMYGPGDDPKKFTTWIVDRCLKHEPEIKLTLGEQRRDFIYITDAIAAYMRLLECTTALGAGFQEVGLGSGVAGTVRSFVETVHQLCASRSHLCFGALPYRDHEQMESRANTQRLRDLGWKCHTSLREGLLNMIEALE